MVIGKDKKKIKELEDKVEILTDKLTDVVKVLEGFSVKANEIEISNKELSEIIANAIDNDDIKKTPQQLMKEWFIGDEVDE